MAEQVKPKIDPSWYKALQKEFESTYFQELKHFLQQEKAAGKTIYPAGSEIFNAFNLCPLPQVKCVILGQDPYHGPNQAHGLCFSVRKGIKPPPSLVNIYKEINAGLGLPIPTHGELTGWARQGVLMLNAVLTVEASKPASHQNRGWENFTDSAIKAVSEQQERVVFMLWGRFARSKKQLIDAEKHLILEAAHPSPFSAHSGFFGCKHFALCNQYLAKNSREPIDWRL
ncbi:uracil-DNA glycosylase [bacterium]|nr:uracil-DNA glycosylase [bacterium]